MSSLGVGVRRGQFLPLSANAIIRVVINLSSTNQQSDLSDNRWSPRIRDKVSGKCRLN